MEEIPATSTIATVESQKRARVVLMHPAIYIGTWAVLGTLFALQDWLNLRRWGYHIGVVIELEAWGMEFVIWGVLSWLLWRLLGPFIQNANLATVLSRILPLSAATSAAKEMLFVLIFPGLPLNRPHMPYWTRLRFHLYADIVGDMVVFWCSFLLFRGLGYYQRSRESENTAAQLEIQLANARLSALRMQLNPHFLFNAMNSISSLMRTDVDAADEMLEQLSSLLRITLERGSVQLIPLRDEIEFIEVYLSMQDRRYSDRVRREISVDPQLQDVLVPAMILRPVVENAYSHELSKIEKGGELLIQARETMKSVVFTITNSGVGIGNGFGNSNGHGPGIANIGSRLQLHYGNDWSFELAQTDRTHVTVKMTLPIQLEDSPKPLVTHFGAE
jgi:two-component system LytT family sensor kinase